VVRENFAQLFFACLAAGNLVRDEIPAAQAATASGDARVRDQRRLRGTIRLGLTREYLDWLPNPEEVFNRKQGGYLWTNVRLFGTLDDPEQDLSPRIIELFKQSPGAYLGLLFRQFEGWLKKAFSHD